MRFNSHKLFSYDEELAPENHLLGILRRAADPATRRVKLSATQDLEETLIIIQEWYRQVPRIVIKELKRAEDGLAFDDLYNEPAKGRREFSRLMSIHTHVTYQDPDIKYDKIGQSVDQPITCHHSLLDLFEHDYFPDVGDMVLYLGRPYQVTKTWVPVSDQMQATGVPLHVCSNAEIFRHGDSAVPRSLVKHGMQDPHAAPLMNRLQDHPL